MPNGAYGRFVPRFALAVADYRALFGEWPTHARGRMIHVLICPPGRDSDWDDHHEYSPELADRLKATILCNPDDSGPLVELSGPRGKSEGYGESVEWGSPEAREAFFWLYGREP